jgi:DNA-directed RNA polymerase specialized sigma24 family protein
MSDFRIDAGVLPEAELQTLSEQIVHYSNIVRSYRSSHYSWMDMDTFRAAYNKGEVRNTTEVTIALSSLRDLSGRMVYGFGRLAFSIASSFRAAPGTQKHDDYMAECLMAIDNCCFGYDGSNKFITYVTIAMQRRLINYKKREKMKEQREFTATTDPIEQADRGGSDYFPITGAPDHRSNEQEMLQDAATLEDAITMADLSELERALVEAELRGEKGFRAKVAQQFFNPTTQKPITRMAAGYAYERAIEKLRRAMNKLARRAT